MVKRTFISARGGNLIFILDYISNPENFASL